MLIKRYIWDIVNNLKYKVDRNGDVFFNYYFVVVFYICFNLSKWVVLIIENLFLKVSYEIYSIVMVLVV